jgi:GTP-binding protein
LPQARPKNLEAEFIISAASIDLFPKGRCPEIAFLGRSNVGKSTLLNCLLGEKKLARTSATPGCTQGINFFRVGDKLVFVDLPGYGYAKAPLSEKARWKRLVEGYLFDRSHLALSILLLDARRGWMEPDLELKEWLEFQGKPYVVVATKIDKLKSHQERERGLAAVREEYPDGTLVPFSAVTGQGVKELWQAIWKTRDTP